MLLPTWPWLTRKKNQVPARVLGNIRRPKGRRTSFRLRVEELNRRLMPAAWNSTKLSLFGFQDKFGATVTPNGSFFASDSFAIYRSLDQGTTWPQVTSLGTFPGKAISYAPSDPNIMIAPGSTAIIKSVDGGTNWFGLGNLRTAWLNTITFEPGNALTVYAGSGYGGYGGELYKSTNGGATWTTLLSLREVYAIAIDPHNPQVVYVGCHNSSSIPGGVLKSTNGGAVWSYVLQNTEVNTIAVDPADPQRIYIGTLDGGIHKSTNGGTTWIEVTGPAIASPVSALAFDPQNSARLFAATTGEGIFVSPNGGATWSADNQGLTDLGVAAMAVQTASPYRILVVTHSGKGFWKTLSAAPPAAPRVATVAVNNGEAQRSRVTSLTVSFSSTVTLASTAALTLTRIGGGAVNFSASAATVGGVTVVTLNNFTGAETSSGSLNDGRYTLTALANQITANGLQLDGNGDGTGSDNFVLADSGQAGGLYRLFGDVNGDRIVNGTDFGVFRTAFGAAATDIAFDYTGDGIINGADFAFFRTRFGGSM